MPCSSLFQTVTVRCGHCSNLLYVNLRALLLPAAANQLPPFGGQALLSPTSPHGLLVSIRIYTAYYWSTTLYLLLVFPDVSCCHACVLYISPYYYCVDACHELCIYA